MVPPPARVGTPAVICLPLARTLGGGDIAMALLTAIEPRNKPEMSLRDNMTVVCQDIWSALRYLECS
jgi:hypothetical protein